VVIRKSSEAGSSRVESSFETTACQDMSLGAEELNWVRICRIMARKKLGGAKKSSREIINDSESVTRYEDTTSEDWNPSACVTVNFKVYRSAIALYCVCVNILEVISILLSSTTVMLRY
jgi:hypothetical protein